MVRCTLLPPRASRVFLVFDGTMFVFETTSMKSVSYVSLGQGELLSDPRIASDRASIALASASVLPLTARSFANHRAN